MSSSSVSGDTGLGVADPDTADLIACALSAGRTALSEWDSKTLIAAYGIAVPESVLVRSASEAADAVRRLGGKVALKAVGADIQHKTELGLVVLGVEDRKAAASIYGELVDMAGGALEGVLVERMVHGDRELMLGMKRDPSFGPVIAFGIGGILTEALADVALAVAPVDPADVGELLDLVRAQRLLGEFRGGPPVDRQALIRAVLALSRIAMEHPGISEIDVNPLIIEDGHPVAVDALILVSPELPTFPTPSDFVPRLRSAVAPRSVAVIGASDDLTKWGGSALRSILDGGYMGNVYPVNHRGGEFFGIRAYPSVSALPEAPDLALLALGADRVPSMLEDCGRRGVSAAVVITAGFSEMGAQGAHAEREIARIAARAGMTLIGPNCMGLLSNEARLHAIGFIVTHPKKGVLSIVSQSGNIGVQMVKACERRDIGIEKFVSVGNEAQVGVLETLDYLADDPHTGCVVLYMEGVDDGRRFIGSMRRATIAKPVVLLRGGLTDEGARAAASHTGAMVGSAAIFEAAARQAGAVMCTSAQDALDMALAFAHLPLPAGRRIAVVTNGGGVGVLMADELTRNGLLLADLPDSLFAMVDSLLPPFYSRRNPVDMVACAGGEVAPRIVEAVAACDSVDAVVVLSVLGVANAGDDARPVSGDGSYACLSPWETAYMTKVADLIETTAKPIINIYDNPVRQSVFDTGRSYSPVILSSPRAAALTLAHMVWYSEYRRKKGEILEAQVSR